MFKQLLTVFYRNALRSKGTFVIYTIGFSTALTSVILIYLWIADELSFDQYHTPQLYQAMYHQPTDHGIQTSGQTPTFLAQALKADIPEVAMATVATPPHFLPEFTLSTRGQHVKGIVKFASEDFFNMFSYPLVAGAPGQVLKEKYSVVISQHLAKTLFGNNPTPIGETFSYSLLSIQQDVIVAGVFQDLPANSSEQFDLVLPFAQFQEIVKPGPPNWTRPEPFSTYVLLKDNSNLDVVNQKLSTYIQSKDNAATSILFLKQYSDNYLYGQYTNGKPDGGRINYVIMFGIIALCIVTVASINFINLSTARATQRVKQIGIKKTVGASRTSLTVQQLGETIFLTLLSLAAALLLVKWILPNFNVITQKHLTLAPTYRFVLSLMAITFTTGILAGIYPALYLSGIDPVKALKGKAIGPSAGNMVRQGLVVFQFTASIIFIIAVIIIYKQIAFVQSKDLGYQKNNLLYFDIDGALVEKTDAFLTEVKRFPGVVQASGMLGYLTGEATGISGSFTHRGKTITCQSLQVSFDMIETLGLKVKEGRSFLRQQDAGQTNNRWILNEAAVDAMGEEHVVGKVIDGKEVIGVVKNFHVQSLHEMIKPMALALVPNQSLTLWVRMLPGKEEQTIDYLQKLYTTYNPGFTFRYHFIDQVYARQYASEQRISLLSKYFAGLAIIISCLGLLGLAVFTLETRKKEISIRKVLGSSGQEVMLLLLNGFTRPVFMAIVLALPVSYLLARAWLNTFAYTAPLSAWYFAIGGLLPLAITWITVGSVAITAIRTNPVQHLRHD
ncbi:ABC transporter permease [Fulvivirgaceae bacterium PWU5]|uniref:ABC transporter permease n=1 Tax=Dawidia cretensis TaxID=2782350 RepID=A0AAP2DYT3_9BACT|nr:ABC transporter permease [Dawidia cretensis]MBT1708259.1 ABC transporter permease [Dawidia cretensis]